MAKKKNYYYVLVFSNTGPVYVTSIDSSNKYAHWDKDKAPMELGLSYAEDLAMGLMMNFNHAVVVKSPREIERQPYRYEAYDCTFVERNKEEEK